MTNVCALCHCRPGQPSNVSGTIGEAGQCCWVLDSESLAQSNKDPNQAGKEQNLCFKLVHNGQTGSWGSAKKSPRRFDRSAITSRLPQGSCHISGLVVLVVLVVCVSFLPRGM